MNWQEFEDNLKDTVGGHETPVDTDALWERIQPPRKRRRWFLLPLVGCFGGLLGLTALAVGLGLFWGKTGSVATESSPNSNAVEVAPAVHNPVVQTPTVAAPATAVAPTANALPAPGKPGRNVASTVPQQQPAAHKKSGLIQIQRVQNQKLTTKNPSANHSNTPSISQPTAASSTISTTPTTSQSTAVSSTVASTPTPTATTAVLAVQEAQPYRPGCPRVATLLAQVNCHTCQPTDTVSRPAPTNNLPPTPPQSPTWQIGVEAGLYAWQRLAKPASTTDLPRDGEQQLEAFSLGLSIQKQVHPHWVVRTGVQYQRLNSVYRWQRSWRDTLPQQIPNFYVDGSSDTTVGGPTIYLTERQVRHYNHLTQWSIPVDFQYVAKGGKQRWAPYVGLRLQYQQQASGLISGADGFPSETALGTTYRRSLVLGAQAGVVWERPLGPRSWLTVAPGVAVDLSRRASPTERLVQCGVQVGWRYALR